MNITIELKKRFCKDFDIPIKIFDSPYFESRLELFDHQYNTLEKWNVFLASLSLFENQQDYFEEYNRIKDTCINQIKNNKYFEEFNNYDMNKYKVNTHGISNHSIYTQQNIGKRLVSFDLKQANFNSLRFFNKNLVDYRSTWEEYISQFTNIEHIINSKYIRQVILGNCNPKRHTTIEKHMTSLILEKVLEEVSESNILTFTEDEFVMKKLNFQVNYNTTAQDIANEYDFPISIEEFTLCYIESIDTYYKLFDDKTIEIKCANSFTLPFLLRKLKKEEYNDYDRIFYHEGFLCEIKKPPIIEV